MSINWSNVTSPERLLAVPNLNTGGWFWTACVYMVWIVLLLAFLGFNFEIAVLTSSFIALIASIILVYAGLMAWEHCLFFGGAILFMIIYIAWSNSRTSY